MENPPRPKAFGRTASRKLDSLDKHFENYFIVARNRGDRHNEVTIRREKTDQYLSLASRDYRFGNADRGVDPHDRVYVYAAIQLVWDREKRLWTLPPHWAALIKMSAG